jgi:hypothetical protein
MIVGPPDSLSFSPPTPAIAKGSPSLDSISLAGSHEDGIKNFLNLKVRSRLFPPGGKDVTPLQLSSLGWPNSLTQPPSLDVLPGSTMVIRSIRSGYSSESSHE